MSANFNENKFSWNWTRISFRVLVSTQTAITLSSIVYKMAKRFASHNRKKFKCGTNHTMKGNQ